MRIKRLSMPTSSGVEYVDLPISNNKDKVILYGPNKLTHKRLGVCIVKIHVVIGAEPKFTALVFPWKLKIGNSVGRPKASNQPRMLERQTRHIVVYYIFRI